MTRFLPFLELRDYRGDEARADAAAAIAVAFLSVPQAVAYAVIAGLPPAMGLYAAAVPAIIGSLMRSSRHVVAGPSNAVSLLVGLSIAAVAGDPVVAAVTLAFMVGVMQVAAGVLSLGAIVDYISSAVVLGYIAGAGTLIIVGQLPNITATAAVEGDVLVRIGTWVGHWGDASGLAVALALGTAAGMFALRAYAPKAPAAVIGMAAGIGLSWAFDLGGRGLPLVRDLASVPQGLPPLTLPDLDQWSILLPAAVAATVLSLIESSAVARAIAARSGQRLDTDVDFVGQGLSNVAAAFTGGYPISGSLSRSALNERAGAQTRVAGALSGAFMLVVLLFLGPIVDLTPVATLAGVLLVVAVGLIDVERIRAVVRASTGDRLAFLATVVGTWTLPLDQAIYLGVGISIVLFLRKARLLRVRELRFDEAGRMAEAGDDPDDEPTTRCSAIRVLHVEGSLFFGAANELRSALDHHLADDTVRVLILRLKRARGLDATTAAVLASTQLRMREQGRTLLLVGMRKDMVAALESTGLAAQLGSESLFPTRPTWFEAMGAALRHAAELVGDHGRDCPVRSYLDAR